MGESGAVRLEGDDASTRIVSLYQKQRKIYPRAVSGWFAGWRWALVWATQLLYYGLPWLSWNDRQAILFDLVSRRFYVFGLVLYPQDFIYLTGLLIVCAYSLFLFTAVAGRLWCGYACPQTVYSEMFLWVERRIEGDRASRIRLDTGPWSLDRSWRKVAKHGVWLAVSLWTGFTLVGYFTPIRNLWAQALTLGFGPWETFWVLFYGLATYGNAGFLREQVCKYMCPYARFQGAMFDRDTLIISYDSARGEPRGARGRRIDPRGAGLGDCIDCGLCVQVCPTGIDIRNGLQLECIGCAACIDACDDIMRKLKRPTGLVRYDSTKGLQGLKRRVLRPRLWLYAAMGLLGLTVLGTTAFFKARPIHAEISRMRGAPYFHDATVVRNHYQTRLINKRNQPVEFRLSLEDAPAGFTLSGVDGTLTLAPLQEAQRPLVILVERDNYSGPVTLTLRFDADPGGHQIRQKVRFLGPAPR